MAGLQQGHPQHPSLAQKRPGWLLALFALVATASLAAIPFHESLLSPFSQDHPAGTDTKVSPDLLPVPGGDPNAGGTVAEQGSWTEIVIRRGDTFTNLMQQAGFDIGDLISTLRHNDRTRPLKQLRPGQRLRVRANSSGRILEVTYPVDLNDSLRIVRSDSGFDVRREPRQLETRLAHVSGTIHTSLFDDGHDAGLSDALVLKLVEIFGWDIDFALDIRPGDRFSVIHEEKYWLGQRIADGAILAAEFVNRGRTHRAFAYRDPSGVTRYYEDDGQSKQRDFLRTPIEFSRISSGFSLNRFHPILKTWTAHKGVDYAAPSGTPVRATAEGRVLEIGTEGGYGKRIVLRHNGAHSTLYAHLSRFQNKLRRGSHVTQGQVIGYVGTSGLSTGPHLHYEFRVDGEHRNSLKMKFPGSAPIPAEYREAFLSESHALSVRLETIALPAVAINSR